MILQMRVHSMLWEQFTGPSLKAMRTLPTRPHQGYGNISSLSHPDTRVRKPDCLHLSYNKEAKSTYQNNKNKQESKKLRIV